MRSNRPDPHSAAQPSEIKATVNAIMTFHDQMERERREWEPLWKDVATFIDPTSDDFGAEAERKQGQKKGERVFDNTAIMARDRLAAAHESMLTPRNAKWHGLRSTAQHLNDIEEVQEWFEKVVARVFAARYSPKANFASQIGSYYQALDTFGTAGLFIDENVGRGLRYKAMHLNELYIAEDFQGRVDRVHRKFTLTAAQAGDMLKKGRFSSLPKDMIAASNDPSRQLEKYWFVHCVYQNDDGGYSAPGRNSWAWESRYIAYDYEHQCAEGGYRTMPFAVGRYMTGPRETYGRAPGMTVLRDIQMLSEMNKTAIREAQRLADPPMFMQGQPGNTPFSMRSGAINWGMAQDGKPLAVPFQSNADLSALLELIQDRRQSVNDAFLVTLFQILLDKPPNMTATEAMLRAQEKGVLLAPTMGRQQSEFLGPLIEREIDILTEAGEFDDIPMPNVLRQYGAGIEIVYDAPLNRLQKTDEAVGILRTVEALAEPAKIDPTVYDVFQWSKVARTMAEANGAPASVLNSLEEMEALQQQRQQENQVQQAAVAGPAIAKTVESLTQAQAVAQNNPAAIPLVQPA
jgi:hypothetical protein